MCVCVCVCLSVCVSVCLFVPGPQTGRNRVSPAALLQNSVFCVCVFLLLSIYFPSAQSPGRKYFPVNDVTLRFGSARRTIPSPTSLDVCVAVRSSTKTMAGNTDYNTEPRLGERSEPRDADTATSAYRHERPLNKGLFNKGLGERTVYASDGTERKEPGYLKLGLFGLKGTTVRSSLWQGL